MGGISVGNTAGAYIEETDLSPTTNLSSVTTVAAVFGADQGPLIPTYISGSYNGNFVPLYGNPDPNTSYIHDCVQPILNNGAPMWALRVVNGATYAGTTYYNQSSSVTASVGFPNTDIITSSAYNGGSRQLQTLTFSSAIITGNVVTVPIINSAGITTNATATYNTSNDATLTALANSIIAAIGNGPNGDPAVVSVIQVSGTTGSSNREILIQCPFQTQAAFGTVTITGGSSQATGTINLDAQLFDVFAENPGAWANSVGVMVTNIDAGTPNRVNLTFSQALVTGNIFTGTLNGVTVGPITFANTSNSTMSAIATAISQIIGVLSATVVNVSGSVSNNRTIQIVSSVSAPNYLVFANLGVTGGATQPTVSTSTVITGVVPSGQFHLQVYLSTNINTPVETFTCTLGYSTDGLGNQLNIAQQINSGANKSQYIRIYQPTWSQGLSLYGNYNNANNVDAVDSIINYLTGGSNGALVTTAQLNAGLQTLNNRQTYPFNILISAGYTDPYYQQDLVSFCSTRQDCFAILDMPTTAQSTGASATAYRQQNVNIDSSYGAIYSPWIQVVDPVTDALRYAPPSGAAAAAYVYNDNVKNIAHAPAGMQVGVVNTNALPTYYNINDTNILYTAQINPIIKRNGAIVIWDCLTLQTTYSALSYIPVRRMISYIEITIADAIDYNTFDPNDSATQFALIQKADSLLSPLLAAQEIQAYAIVCNGTNNTPDIVDAGQLLIDLFITPTLPARQIIERCYITAQGVNFQTLEASVGDSGSTA